MQTAVLGGVPWVCLLFKGYGNDTPENHFSFFYAAVSTVKRVRGVRNLSVYNRVQGIYSPAMCPWQMRWSGLHITHQPQVFLLISSNPVSLSGERWNSADMSVIVWTFFKWVSGSTAHCMHLEKRPGYVWHALAQVQWCKPNCMLFLYLDTH